MFLKCIDNKYGYEGILEISKIYQVEYSDVTGYVNVKLEPTNTLKYVYIARFESNTK